MKNKKGYSLIEIVIGLAIITIFLLSTGSLINASYTNYQLVMLKNEAMELAITEMENILISGDDYIKELSDSSTGSDNEVLSYNGHTAANSMEVKTKIERIKEDDKIYDKVFKVTVNVEYKKSANDEKKYNIELQSLKILK